MRFSNYAITTWLAAMLTTTDQTIAKQRPISSVIRRRNGNVNFAILSPKNPEAKEKNDRTNELRAGGHDKAILDVVLATFISIRQPIGAGARHWNGNILKVKGI